MLTAIYRWIDRNILEMGRGQLQVYHDDRGVELNGHLLKEPGDMFKGIEQSITILQ